MSAIGVSQPVLAEIQSLGGRPTVMDDQLLVEFEEGTSTENQNRIFALLQGAPLDGEDTVPSQQLTRGPSGENWHHQSVAAEEWYKTEGKRLARIGTRVHELGGSITTIHDEVVLSFPEDTPVEKKEEMIALFLSQRDLPKVPVDADPPSMARWEGSLK